MMPVYPDGHVIWDLWYMDTFDRETPRQKLQSGNDLQAGLLELWKLFLFESIDKKGNPGFSLFNLWLKEEGRSIDIEGDLAGALKIRVWTGEDQRLPVAGHKVILERIVKLHAEFIQDREICRKILSCAAGSVRAEDFEEALEKIRVC